MFSLPKLKRGLRRLGVTPLLLFAHCGGADFLKSPKALLQIAFKAAFSLASCSSLRLVRNTEPPNGAIAGITLSAVIRRINQQSAAGRAPMLRLHPS